MGKTEDLACHAPRATSIARPTRGVVLPDAHGDVVVDRARRSGTSGSHGGIFPFKEMDETIFNL
jgi:hypothetical protein